MTRWKWRRKLLERLILAMEMARSSSADVESRIEAKKGQVLAPNALKSRDRGQDCAAPGPPI
jgi:hypothetical protein